MAPEFLIELGQTKLGLKKKKRQKYSTCTIRIFTSQNQQCPCMATSERLFLSRWIIWALSATPPADLALPSWTIIFYFLFSLHCRVFLPLPAINANGFAQISSCYLLSLKNLISSLDLNINMQKKNSDMCLQPCLRLKSTITYIQESTGEVFLRVSQVL